MAHGGLARAVGAHQDMGLARAHREVDAPEDGLVVDRCGEPGDVEQGCCAHIKSFRGARMRLVRHRPFARARATGRRAADVRSALNSRSSLGLTIR